MNRTKLALHVADFVERVGSTAVEAGLAVYLTSSNGADVKTAVTAAGLAALKFVWLAVRDWQVAHGIKG